MRKTIPRFGLYTKTKAKGQGVFYGSPRGERASCLPKGGKREQKPEGRNNSRKRSAWKGKLNKKKR